MTDGVLQPNAFLAAPHDRLVAGMRALVPGDGEGRNRVWLAAQGLKVDTLDLSAHGVAKAKRLAAERGVSINAILDRPGRRLQLNGQIQR